MQADNGGVYPETVAFTLWGTDNIKTYGESLAQVRVLFPLSHVALIICFLVHPLLLLLWPVNRHSPSLLSFSYDNQVLALVGVKPVPDSIGRVNKLELIPLEDLGRPRIDVVVRPLTLPSILSFHVFTLSPLAPLSSDPPSSPLVCRCRARACSATCSSTR